MIAARVARVTEILAKAAELEPHERRAFVVREARGDRDLESEVLSLLAHHESADQFLETPAVVAAIGGAPAMPRAPVRDDEGPNPTRPARIGSYAIESVLGEGGMGVVYLARQENPSRFVALKVIRPGFATPRLLKRFERESALQGRLHHPGIGQIFEAGSADVGGVSVPYLAMELVRGTPLTEYAASERLDVRARLELFAEVCDAVEHAHRQGVLHRDLKPANILVEAGTGRARPKVLDFGIARDADDSGGSLVTGTGQVVGTLAYMSPEQAGGARHDIGARSDVYSLGVILYELLTDRLPHDVSSLSFSDAARRIFDEDPAPPSRFDHRLAGDVDTILAKCLAKEPARRYATPAELAADVRDSLDDRPIRARPPSRGYRLQKFARRNRALVAGSLSVFVVLVLGIVSTTRQAILAADEARTASTERDKARAAESLAESRADETARALQRESEALVRVVQEKDRAQSVSEYFQHLIANVVPGERGPDARLVDLLERAERELPGALANAPRAEIGVRATLGQALARLGRLDEAETALRTALAVAQQNDVEELEAADVGAYLGGVLVKRDRLAEAEPILREAHASLAHALGETSERALMTLLDISSVERRLGRAAEAEATARRALELARDSTCDDDDPAATALRALGLLSFQRGKLGEAEVLQREALERITAWRGELHPLALAQASELASTLFRLEQWEEAERLQRRTVEIGERILGERHPDHIAAMNNLASVLAARRSFQEALALRRRVAFLTEEVLGHDHENTWTARENLALLLAKGGTVVEAEEMLRGVLAQERERFGTHDRRTLSTLHNLGSLLREVKKYEEALEIGDELVEAADATLPADDWQRALFRAGRGVCRARADKRELAEEDLLAAHAALDRLLGPANSHTQSVRRNLAKLYVDWQRPDDAERWR